MKKRSENNDELKRGMWRFCHFLGVTWHRTVGHQLVNFSCFNLIERNSGIGRSKQAHLSQTLLFNGDKKTILHRLTEKFE